MLGRLLGLLAALLLVATPALAQGPRLPCDDNGTLCTETVEPYNYEGQYTGHDEPSLLFYSSKAGSGNSNFYVMQLPKDPPTLPKQDGTGGTFNFQLHPAFWFGMALCDDQSAPNPKGISNSTNIPCTPDSDSNIFDNSDTTAADYMGKHPGGAFMEMQFYPPGWVLWPNGNSCDATHWCAALNIDSFSENQNTGALNNVPCQETAGTEYVNFAFITKNGIPHAPPSPLTATLATFTANSTTDLFMNSGDVLAVSMFDTPSGFKVVIRDLSTGRTGSMTASAANGFAEVLFDPNGNNCDPATHNLLTNFHPMYSTSSEHTRLQWTAHSYNVAFSDEIGHFEYCDAASTTFPFPCTDAGVNDPSGVDADDIFCFNAGDSSLIQVGGCLFTDFDFDGVPYQLVWPGTLANRTQDTSLHPQPVRFTSPIFKTGQGDTLNYSRVAFETDLPRIEGTIGCDRFTGAGCVNPPPGVFYPIYTTAQMQNGENCIWQLGGANIQGTINTFGGTSTAEYGSLLLLTYPTVGGTSNRFNDYRQVLNTNPCPAEEQ